MNIVVTYATRTPDGDDARTKTIPVGKRITPGTWNWQEFVTAAIFHKMAGERIVSIAEEGYEYSS